MQHEQPNCGARAKTWSASAIDQLADWAQSLSFSHALWLIPIHSEKQILSNSFGAHSTTDEVMVGVDLPGKRVLIGVGAVAQEAMPLRAADRGP
jgi:hypothetical protein